MPHSRFYMDHPLEEGAQLTLEGEEFIHLARVMRKKEGEQVELLNGRGVLAHATLTHVGKREALLRIEMREKRAPLLPPLTLVLALPKAAALELVVQKGTELGVSAFHLYHSTRSEQQPPSSKLLRRLLAICICAMKQCGRCDLPTLSCGFPPLQGRVYFGDLTPSAPPLSEVGSLPATLIIGPEKGWSAEEVEHLQERAEGVSLSPYTLRAESAAIAGVALLAGGKRKAL